MAIYEPRGRRVQLEGTEISRGFKAQQVFDPSEQMLREGQRRAAQYERVLSQLNEQGAQNVEALSGFSNTLSKFLVERQTKLNEEQKNLGIADIINGDTNLNQDLLAEYQEKKTYLKKAHDAELEVIEGYKQEDPGFAETLYQKSPAINGWRAYGQAIGKTQMAASMSGTFFESFLKSDTPIEITNETGKQEKFTPRTATTQEQLAAVWNVAMQKFIEQSGMNQINPVILAEHLTPVVVRNRAELLGQRMREIIETRDANEREDRRTEIITAAPEMSKSREQTQAVVGMLNQRLIELNGNNKTRGNDETHSMMKNAIQSLADKDLRAASQLLDNYRSTLINPEQPTLGTWGDRYNMNDLSEFLKESTDRMVQEAEEAAKAETDGILKVFFANPNSQTYNQARQALNALRSKAPIQVDAALVELTRKGPNWNPGREEDLVRTVKSPAELQALRSAGYISDEAYQRGTLKFAEAKDYKSLLPDENQIDNQVRGKLRELLNDQVGKTEEGFTQKSALTVAAVRGLAMASVMRQIETGQVKDATQAIQAMDNAINTLLPEFIDIKRVNNIPTPTYYASPKSNRIIQSSTAAPIKSSGGQTGLNLINVALSRVPAVTSSFKDFTLDADRFQLTLEVMKNGGKPPADVAFLAKTAGVSVPELLRQQAAPSKLNIPFDVSELGQGAATYQQNRLISPRITEALANPRIVGTQRRQLQIELNRLRNRQSVPTISGPIDVNRFRQAIIGKESGGNYDVVNPVSNAIGIGQVMPENVGPWTKRYFGKRLTPQEFRSNKAAQDAVVNGHLNYLIQQQLLAGHPPDIAIRRAAAIWYSGDGKLYNDTKKQITKGREYPSIRDYTMDILNRYKSGQ